MSRSASMVAAWLIATKGLEVDEAIEFLRSKRPAVSPNEVNNSQESKRGIEVSSNN